MTPDPNLVTYMVDVADSYGIDETIGFNQINQESKWNPNAVSGANAKGLTQFIPATWQRFGSGSPFDPYASLDAWGAYMSFLLTRYNWDYAKALAGYNCGEGCVDACIAKAGSNWLSCTPAQTRNYVAAILGASGTVPAGAAAAASSGLSIPAVFQSSDGSTNWVTLGLALLVGVIVFRRIL